MPTPSAEWKAEAAARKAAAVDAEPAHEPHTNGSAPPPSRASSHTTNGNAPPPDTLPPLPEIWNAEALMEAESRKPRPPQLVEGLVHLGEKLLLAGASKSYKSWTLLDLACSVGTGTPFWEMETAKGRVLALNYEIQPWFFADRLAKVARAKGCGRLDGVDVWNLRGHRAGFYRVLAELKRRLENEDYSLIIIDPLYSGLNGKSESDAAEMALFMNGIEQLAECGPSVALGHHFAKGNSAMKESLDRASGSGVFARDPDAIVTLNRHQTDAAFVSEFTLRNFPALDRLGLRLEFPLLLPDGKVDVDLIKGAQVRKKAVTVADVVALLPLTGGLATGEFKDKAKEQLGIEKTKFHTLLKEGRESGAIVINAESGLNERGYESQVRS
jgi:hypothetical protein